MSRELIPTGTYDDCEIVDHGYDESPDKKTPYLWVIFQVPEQGQITGRFYLPKGSEKGLEASFKKIEAMGFEGDDLGELADGSKLAGNRVQITVEHETWEGTTRDRVGFVNQNHSTVGPSRNDSTAANVTTFNAIWKKGKGKRGQQPAGDDIPF